MAEYDEVQVAEWLREGVAAAKAGRREQARRLLMRVVEANERNEQAWVWLSSVVDSDADRLVCLENVLTLNPDNVQARAGLRWLQERGVDAEPPAPQAPQAPEPLPSAEVADARPLSHKGEAPQPFMTDEGCVYCGLPRAETDLRCPHCGGQLRFKRFKRESLSAEAYLLQPAWTILAGINLIGFFLLGYLWDNVQEIPELVRPYLSFVVGRAVTDPAGVDAFVEPELLLQIARFSLLGLAVLGGLVALGVFLRVPAAHPLGLAVIAVHLVIYIALFILGFTGYLFAPFQLVFALLVARFMFQTVEDFAKEEVQEWLEPDRHVLNDVDFFARGRAYEKRGMWAKALLHWQRAAALNPERDSYLAAMARAYARLGRYEMALEQVEAALRVSRVPEDWQPLRELILEAQRRDAAGLPLAR